MILVFFLINNVKKIRRGCRAQPKAVSEYIILLSSSLGGIRICIQCLSQRHILRPSTAFCPVCWAMDGDKGIEKCTVRKKYLVPGRQEQPSQNKNLLYRHDKPNEPTKEGLLSFVFFEFPFTSVSTVSSGGHPSLISVVCPFVGIGSPHPLPARECGSPPRTLVRRDTLGVGGPNSDGWTESLALCILSGRSYEWLTIEIKETVL